MCMEDPRAQPQGCSITVLCPSPSWAVGGARSLCTLAPWGLEAKPHGRPHPSLLCQSHCIKETTCVVLQGGRGRNEMATGGNSRGTSLHGVNSPAHPHARSRAHLRAPQRRAGPSTPLPRVVLPRPVLPGRLRSVPARLSPLPSLAASLTTLSFPCPSSSYFPIAMSHLLPWDGLSQEFSSLFSQHRSCFAFAFPLS